MAVSIGISIMYHPRRRDAVEQIRQACYSPDDRRRIGAGGVAVLESVCAAAIARRSDPSRET
jgi:hypothetical protein